MFARSGSSAIRRCSYHRSYQNVISLSTTSNSVGGSREGDITAISGNMNIFISHVQDAEPKTQNGSTTKNVKPTITTSTNTMAKRDFSSAALMDSSSFDTPSDSPKRSPLNTQAFNNDDDDDTKSIDVEMTLKEIHPIISQPCTPLSLANMYKYASANAKSKNYAAQRLRNAQFLHRELQIRIAQRAADLLNLPHGLNNTKPVQDIAKIYLRYLQEFKTHPCPTNNEEELAFTEMLRPMVLDRGSIPKAIAQGVASIRDTRREDLDLQRLEEMEKALYRFFTARTGLRLLTEHHILSSVTLQDQSQELRTKQSCIRDGATTFNSEEDEDSFLGCIKANCDPAVEARRVADHVMNNCRENFGVSPEIEVLDCTPEHFAEKGFTYIPHHLQYMLAELLKNSCRATVRRYIDGTITTEDHSSLHNLYEGDEKPNAGVLQGASLPPIRVVIVKGAEDVTIKIADKGGGVARSVIDKMWTFAHTSTSDEVAIKEKDTHFDGFTGGKIRGFGLPLARIYARYFGGELTLKSMEGYGVDAYLYLPVLGVACENLPRAVLKSPGNFDSSCDANLKDLHQADSFNISGVEPWGGGRREYSTSTGLVRLKRYAL